MRTFSPAAIWKLSPFKAFGDSLVRLLFVSPHFYRTFVDTRTRMMLRRCLNLGSPEKATFCQERDLRMMFPRMVWRVAVL
jgi:hypothetical protein